MEFISWFTANIESEMRRRRLVTAWYLFHWSISPTGSSGAQWETIDIFATLLLVSYTRTVSSSLGKVTLLVDRWIVTSTLIIWQNECAILLKIYPASVYSYPVINNRFLMQHIKLVYRRKNSEVHQSAVWTYYNTITKALRYLNYSNSTVCSIACLDQQQVSLQSCTLLVIGAKRFIGDPYGCG